MKLIQETNTDKTLQQMSNYSNHTENYVKGAILALNRSYDALWKSPEGTIQETLQRLLTEGQLETVFTNHYLVATSLNSIAETVGLAVRATDVRGRDFTVESGVLSLVPLVTGVA